MQNDGAEVEIAEAIDNAGRSGADRVLARREVVGNLFPFNLGRWSCDCPRGPVGDSIGHTTTISRGDAAGAPEPPLAAEAIVKKWAAGRDRLARCWEDAREVIGV